MSLDLAVSQAILRIRALERALHENPHSWSIELDGHGSVARRRVHTDGVTFQAPFAGHWQGTFPATLYCGADPVLVRAVTLDVSGEFDLDWVLGVPDAVAA